MHSNALRSFFVLWPVVNRIRFLGCGSCPSAGGILRGCCCVSRAWLIAGGVVWRPGASAGGGPGAGGSVTLVKLRELFSFISSVSFLKSSSVGALARGGSSGAAVGGVGHPPPRKGGQVDTSSAWPRGPIAKGVFHAALRSCHPREFPGSSLMAPAPPAITCTFLRPCPHERPSVFRSTPACSASKPAVERLSSERIWNVPSNPGSRSLTSRPGEVAEIPSLYTSELLQARSRERILGLSDA